MKILSYFTFAFLILFFGCEDKKKAPEVHPEKTAQIAKDTVQTEKPLKAKDDSDTPKYPKITNENVVSFLTEYGKKNPETVVLITTNLGNITIQLFEDTPLHRANFIYLVKQGYFNTTFFHRVVPDFIIQGGSSDDVSTSNQRNDIGNDYLLPAEIIPGRNHGYGTVSGAKQYRENPNKKSAPFEFFIFLGPIRSTAHLNGNYTVFGKVTQGMDVVEKIANVAADGEEWPLQNVYIKAEVVR